MFRIWRKVEEGNEEEEGRRDEGRGVVVYFGTGIDGVCERYTHGCIYIPDRGAGE